MKEIIKKIDAAQRQLDLAITLWFQEADTISTHTLACSAHQIIHEIHQNRKSAHLLFNSIYIKNERRQHFVSIVKDSYNFFKHANRDPDPEGVIEFDRSFTEIFILFTILGIESLGYNLSLVSKIFFVYCSIHNPDFLSSRGVEFFIKRIPVNALNKVRDLNRKQFFNSVFLLLSKHNV